MYNNKKIGLIIPTRYNSERLPGKVLMNIAGKKQIEWIIERALHSQYIDMVILAVSDKENKPILKWYDKANISNVGIYIGDHNNIIKRCIKAAQYYSIDVIVDTSHDCTFFDPFIADTLIKRLFDYNADYSANCITRSFYNGADIQIYTKEIYNKAYMSIHRHNYYSGWNIFHNREFINPKPKIINLEATPEYFYPSWHLCLDTQEDKILIEKILNHFINKNIRIPNYKQITNFLKNNLELLNINKDIKDTPILKEKI